MLTTAAADGSNASAIEARSSSHGPTSSSSPLVVADLTPAAVNSSLVRNVVSHAKLCSGYQSPRRGAGSLATRRPRAAVRDPAGGLPDPPLRPGSSITTMPAMSRLGSVGAGKGASDAVDSGGNVSAEVDAPAPVGGRCCGELLRPDSHGAQTITATSNITPATDGVVSCQRCRGLLVSAAR